MTTTTITLTRVARTCLAAPISWDAWDADGAEYFLRHRHGRGRIEAPEGLAAAFTDDLDMDDPLADMLARATAAGPYAWALAPDVELIPYDYSHGDEPLPPAPAPAPAGPVPLLEGSFAFFRPGPDALLLVWRKKGTDQDHHMPIPPMVLTMAAQMGGLSLDDIIAKIEAGELK